MWKQNRISNRNWCVPRKVVNIYSENESSIEKIVTDKKKRKTKSLLRIKHIMKVKKGKLAQSETITDSTKKKRNPMATGKVKKRALIAIASKRVKELAVPRNAATLNADLKKLRDPFKVRPSALKAFCSPRTKILARPKNAENMADKLRNSIK